MTRATRQHARGFTLMELMVVMGIIVLLLGMGIVAFNTLSGNRSLATAQGQVAAVLARARAMAINAPQGIGGDNDLSAYGVVFFADPQTERTGMMFIRVTGLAGDPDPYDNYKGWVPNVSYQLHDRVVAIVKDTNEGGKPMVRRYRCIAPVDKSDRLVNGPPLTSPPLSDGHWAEIIDGTTATVLDEQIEFLPKGVAVQTLVDPGASPDRYLRTGVILFDRQGRLEHLTYSFDDKSPLCIRMGVTGTIGGTGLYSQYGLVLYDQAAFSGVGNSEWDRDTRAYQAGQTAGNSPTAGNELAEETWLDNNGTMLILNRYSGELTKVR